MAPEYFKQKLFETVMEKLKEKLITESLRKKHGVDRRKTTRATTIHEIYDKPDVY